MKKIAGLIAVMTMAFCLQSDVAAANAAAGTNTNPTCVMMKFTDDTRFDRIESTGTLSDLVMEKLLLSGKFNFKETKVINADLEKALYDERAAEFANAKKAMSTGKYSVLFEGSGFDEKKAQTIATASVGQYVNPAIIASIGQANGAEYLIQGTIINLGTGNWMNTKIQDVMTGINTASSLMGSTAAMSFMGALGPLASLAGSASAKETGIGVQADLRLIKASTGEVVWQKCVVGKQTQTQVKVLNAVKIGSDKLDSEMYYKAMENASQIIADALIADCTEGKLFVK